MGLAQTGTDFSHEVVIYLSYAGNHKEENKVGNLPGVCITKLHFLNHSLYVTALVLPRALPTVA